MKTITFKVDNEFSAILGSLPSQLHMNRSEVIRQAVRSYSEHLEKELLRQKMKESSLKTRNQALQLNSELKAADNDGL